MSSTYYIIIFFIFGLMFGSFFNVVGYRLPKNKSIVYPGSNCPHCGKKLGFIELIPVISYILQLGKCRGCKTKISIKYPLFELLTGMLFSLSYFYFGLSLNLIIGLTFISALIIIVISDVNYMIIPDEIILISSIMIIIEKLIINDFNSVVWSIIYGTLAFILMYLIKLLGDFLFKKESLGGGDIKLMFLIGLVLGIWLSFFVVILASFIALPIAILILYYYKKNIISFAPFLSLVAILFYLFNTNIIDILYFIIKYL